MYVKKPVVESIYDTQILLSICDEELTIKQICDKINSHKPTIRGQIKEDLLKEYVKERKIDKRGMTIHSIKWGKIVKDFLNYLKKISKEKNLSKEQLAELIKRSKSIENNKYLNLVLQIMFKEFFRVYVKNNIPITLEDLFKEMILDLGEKLNPDNISKKIYMEYKDETEFSVFMGFTYFLETYFSSQKIGLDYLFNFELEKEITAKKNK